MTYGNNDFVLLPAGNIRDDGAPTSPIAETAAQSTDMDRVLAEVQRMRELWERMNANDRKTL